MRRIVSSMNVRFENDETNSKRVSRVTRSDVACIVVRRKRAIMRKMTEYNECHQIAASAKLRNLLDVRTISA